MSCATEVQAPLLCAEAHGKPGYDAASPTSLLMRPGVASNDVADCIKPEHVDTTNTAADTIKLY